MSRTTIVWLAGAAVFIALFALAPTLGTTREELGETMTRVLFAATLLAWGLWLVDANRRRAHWQYRYGRDLRAKGRGWAATAGALLIVAAILLVGTGSALAMAAGIALVMLASAELLPR
jgi:hypothetical protein